jgi:hypothetical protein
MAFPGLLGSDTEARSVRENKTSGLEWRDVDLVPSHSHEGEVEIQTAVLIVEHVLIDGLVARGLRTIPGRGDLVERAMRRGGASSVLGDALK